MVIEANHDIRMLQAGPYPYYLKQRILGNRGHLSNERSGQLIKALLNSHIKAILLGHLSKENNFEELAYETVKLELSDPDMGYRIELGEIEAAAGAIEGIRSYACIYDDAEDKIVFIYEGKKLDDAFLLGEFKKKVPHYMEPNQFVRVKSMPHNQNGKIDRKWLKNNYKL